MLGAPPFFAVFTCNLSLWVNSSWQIEGRSHPCTVRVVTEGLSRYIYIYTYINQHLRVAGRCFINLEVPVFFVLVFGGVWCFYVKGGRWHDHVCHIVHRSPEVFLILAAFNFYLDGTRYTWKMWTDVVAVVILATIHLIRAILHPTQILMPLIFALGFFGLWVLLLDFKTVDATFFFCASCSSLFSNLFWWRLCSRVVPWRNYHSGQILLVARKQLVRLKHTDVTYIWLICI